MPNSFPNSAASPEAIPTVIGYQEAWRWWRVDGNDLASVAVGGSCWNWDGENVARFFDYDPDEDGAVDPNLLPFEAWPRGGFYAYKPTSIAGADWATAIFGRVALYGIVIEGERGFRAEKARILDVWADSPTLYDRFAAHPQMKGLFSYRPPGVVNASGEETKEISWLTLENLKESPGLSRSSFLTRRLLFPSGTLMGMMYWNQTWPPTPPRLSNLFLPPQKEWVYKPEFPRCRFCDERLEESQLVRQDEEGEIVHAGCGTAYDTVSQRMEDAIWGESVTWANGPQYQPITYGMVVRTPCLLHLSSSSEWKFDPTRSIV